MTALPLAFLGAPLAHRGLHGLGVPENSRAAVLAAVDAGYGIEIDLQLSSDGTAMVFHDDTLDRLTSKVGPLCAHSAEALSQMALPNGEGIPTLAEVLDCVAGRSALLIEIKDQTGALGPDVGDLESALARALASYEGPVAVMSFNPHSVAAFGKLAPQIARGLTSEDYNPAHWRGIPESTLAGLRGMPMFDEIGAQFISHQASDLGNARVAELKAQGVPVLCWTIRSEADEIRARRVAGNITFEGYAAARP